MKKISGVVILIILLVFVLTIRVNAVSNIIRIDGREAMKVGEKESVTVVALTENFRGLMGKIETSKNITIKTVTAVDGDWTVNYNSDNGAFNLYGGTGTSLMKITYTGTAGAGNITLNNMEMSDNNYETAEVDYVIKPIAINETSSNNENQNVDNKQEEQTGTEDKATGTSKTDNKQTTKKETKTTKAKKDTTISNKILAYTGIGRGMIVIGTIIAIIGGVALYKYRLYRKV